MKKHIIILLTLIVVLYSSCSKEDEAIVSNQQTIIDVTGREVNVTENPENIVIGDHYWETFIVGGNQAFDKVAGWSATTWVKWRNSIYKEFANAVPRLYELVDVGLTFNQTFDLEKFLGLNPDLLILPVYQFNALDAGIREGIEKAGIPIVLIDFSTGTRELHNRSIIILGQIFDQEERALEVNNLYNSYLDLLAERLSEVNVDEKTAYLEKASKGPGIFDETWGSSNWAPIINRAGAYNISEKIIEGVGFADNEFILSEDPDFIFFSGSTWPSKADAIQLGFSISEDETRAKAMRYVKEREGWSQLTAVHDKNIYMMHHGFIRSILDFIPSLYMAEKIYPDIFADVDAMEIASNFFEEYLPVEFNGTWLCSLYE